MQTSETTWELTTVRIVQGEEEGLPMLIEQIKSTLKGLGYTEEAINEQFAPDE